MNKVHSLLFIFGALLIPTFARSLEVPVPDALTQWGYINVEGQPGTQQEANFIALPCQEYSPGVFYRFACKTHDRQVQPLNKPLRVRPGIYLVGYSQTLYPKHVVVEANKTVTLSLKTIHVPKIDSTYTYRVFHDFTNADEQRKFLEVKWVQNDQEMARVYQFLAQFCAIPANEQAWSHICQTLKAPQSYTDLLGSQIWFDSLGNVSTLGFSYNDYAQLDNDAIRRRFGYQGGPLLAVTGINTSGFNREYVTDPKDGDSISVFPGVYGIDFQAKDRSVSTRLGLVVE